MLEKNEEEDGRSVEKGVKRKKKRSVMQMAKKLARRRDFGHGTEVDSETYQYMVRILETMRQDFPTREEKLNFAENVYEETKGREVEYAKNQVGSRVLDSLLEFASLEVIRRLADALGESLRPLCSDRFASHVIQKIIEICAERAAPEAPQIAEESKKMAVDESQISEYNSLALKLSRYVLNNFEEFVWDPYANHVLRAVVRSLGGVSEPKEKTCVPYDKRRTVGEDFTNLLRDFGNRLVSWPQFLQFGKDELTSGLLQTILFTLKGVDSKITRAFVKRIIEECFPHDGQGLPSIFHTQSSLRLLEACLAVVKPKMYGKIYERLFVGHLGELSVMSGANFAVQRLLDNCPTKEEFEKIFEELSQHFPAILAHRNTGVLASLANASLRLKSKQGPFMDSICRSLGCDSSPEGQLKIVPIVAAFESPKKIEKNQVSSDKVTVNLHGSIVLQAMLRFNKPIKIVNSLLAMEPQDLVRLISDPKGSRILDAFMDSEFIGEKSREKLGKNLQGHWISLARDTHGSRCLDKIWAWAKSDKRSYIMDELSMAGESLGSTKSGKLISAKFNVPLYSRSKKDWNEALGKKDKTKALFASIVDSNENAVKN